MSVRSLSLGGASVLLLASLSQPGYAAEAAAANASAGPSSANTVQELIVTAQKREENIQSVGMSIQAASGDKLTKLGVHDTSDLQKIVPGFQSTPTY